MDRIEYVPGIIRTNLLPITDATYDIGSSSKRFKDLYLSGTFYSGASQIFSSSYTLRSNTADGADNLFLVVTPGGAYSSTGSRGGFLYLNGNEVGSGEATLSSGNVGSSAYLHLRAPASAIRFYAGNTSIKWEIQSTGDLIPGSTTSYNIGSAGAKVSQLYLGSTLFTAATQVFSASHTIRADTADGSDNRTLSITAGGAAAANRGATILMYGNQAASNPGTMEILLGTAFEVTPSFKINLTFGGAMLGYAYWNVGEYALSTPPAWWGGSGAMNITAGTSAPWVDPGVHIYCASNALGAYVSGINVSGGHASPSAPGANTKLMSVYGGSYDGTAIKRQAGYITIETTAAWSSGSGPTRIVFGTTATSTPLLRWTIDNVGDFIQNSSNGGYIRLQRSGSEYIVTGGTDRQLTLSGSANTTTTDAALISVHGSTHATYPGQVLVQPANVSTGHIINKFAHASGLFQIRDTSNAVVAEFNNAGDLRFNANLAAVRHVITTISAAGSTTSDATVITSSFSLVTTVGAGQGVRIPASAPVGAIFMVWNLGGTNLKVYPPSGTNIPGYGTDVAGNLAANTGAMCTIIATSGTSVIMNKVSSI